MEGAVVSGLTEDKHSE